MTSANTGNDRTVTSQMAQTGINLYDFRTEFNIPAADIRSICKQLKLDIIKKGKDHFIVEGAKKYKCGVAYLLKHAVLEYRATMKIDNTLAGNFIEYQQETAKGTVSFGISDFSSNAVKPKTPAIKKKPNKKPSVSTVTGNEPVGITNQPTTTKTTRAPKSTSKGGKNTKTSVTPSQPPTTVSNGTGVADILAPQKELLNASAQGFLITTEQLSALVGLSVETVRSKKSGFRKLGFEFIKVREGASTLWKPQQY